MDPDLVGKMLDKYHVLQELGRGGMGAVYLAHDTKLGRNVALKILAPHLAWDPEFVRRFHDEASSAARLRYDNIVIIHNVGEAGGYHFIDMEYLDGATLKDMVSQYGAWSADQVASVVRQIAQALDYAHAQGFIHRDVKPSNIMISPQGKATLMDFGLVKAVEGTQLTRTGTIMGTPPYMAPEQFTGRTVTSATDIYSLGIVTYELLTGKPPFQGDTSVVQYHHVNVSPPPLRSLNAGISPAVESVVLAVLSKEPNERGPSAGAFADRLGRTAAGIYEPPPPLPPPPPDRTKLVWPLVGILAALLVLGAIVVWARQQDNGAASQASATAVAETEAVVAETQAAVVVQQTEVAGQVAAATADAIAGETATAEAAFAESNRRATDAAAAETASAENTARQAADSATAAAEEAARVARNATAAAVRQAQQAAVAAAAQTQAAVAAAQTAAATVSVNFFGRHGNTLPADQKCTELVWETQGVTDVALQVGEKSSHKPVGASGSEEQCFEGDLTAYLYYKLPSGVEERRELIIRHVNPADE